MRIAIVILLLLTAFNVEGTDEKFFKALHQVETSGRVGAVLGDGGLARGPFQIHRAYWQDAIEFRPSIGGRYEDVERIDYAKQIVRAWMQRYCPRAVKAKDYEAMARAHNSGPNWRKKKHLTDAYWKKFKKHL